MKKYVLFTAILINVFFSCGRSEKADLTIDEIRVEYIKNPLGIDTKEPRISWTFSATVRNQFQSAYRILVAGTPELLDAGEADIWDSGKVFSGESINIVYTGKPLESKRRYHVKVKVWNQDGIESPWSDPAWFEMAMIKQEDWSGEWIGDGKPVPLKDEDFYKEIPSPLFRKSFEVKGEVERARLYITGLGYYEAYINGSKVGDHVLDPGWTNYGKRVLYESYDIKDVLDQGPNVIGVMLGNGWYNPLPLGLFRKFKNIWIVAG